MDDEKSVQKCDQSYETRMTSNSGKRQKGKTCNFKPPLNNKRLKTEKENLEIDKGVPTNNSGEQQNILRKSQRGKKQISDVKNISPKVKNGWKKDDNNSENNKTFKNCYLNCMSDNVVKSLDNIFFPEDTNDKINYSALQNNKKGILEKQHISTSPKKMNEFKISGENVVNMYNSLEKGNGDDQTIINESTENDKHFLLNKNVNADICQGTEQTEMKELTDNNEKSMFTKLHAITVDNENREKDEDKITETKRTFLNEQKICVNLECHADVRDSVNDQNKNTKMLHVNLDNAENLKSECINIQKSSELGITESVKETTNKESLFQQNSDPVSMEQLLSDIKQADAIINILASGVNVENCTTNGDMTNIQLLKDITFDSSNKDNAKRNLTENCNENTKGLENNTDGKKECDVTNFNGMDKSTKWDQNVFEENAYLSDKIDGNILHVDQEQVVSGLSLEMTGESIVAKKTLLDDVEMKSVVELKYLNQSPKSSWDNSNEKSSDRTFLNYEKKEYSLERSMCHENSEDKQRITQNAPIHSNDTQIINENIKKEVNKQTIDTMDSVNKNLPSQEKKLTLLYMSALDYDKKYQTKDGDDLNEEKETKDYKKHENFLDDFVNIETDSLEIKRVEINMEDGNKNILNNSNSLAISSKNIDQNLLGDAPELKTYEKSDFPIQNLSVTNAENIITKKPMKEVNSDRVCNKSICNEQNQIHSDEKIKNCGLNDNENKPRETYTRQSEAISPGTSYSVKGMPLSVPFNENSNSDSLYSKTYLDNTIENKIEKAACKNKCLKIPEMSLLVTAKDYFKIEKVKNTEIINETEDNSDIESMNSASGSQGQRNNKGENLEGNETSNFDVTDSFDMDDDFQLTASQLSMIEVDERNHIKILSQEKENSTEQTISCANTHFNSDSVTVDIMDQLCYIRESVESIKELLTTLLKKK